MKSAIKLLRNEREMIYLRDPYKDLRIIWRWSGIFLCQMGILGFDRRLVDPALTDSLAFIINIVLTHAIDYTPCCQNKYTKQTGHITDKINI